MPEKLKMFPLLIDRWVGGTQYMTHQEKGFYLDLILYLFTEQRPIKDVRHVARITSTEIRTARNLWAQVCDKFVKHRHGHSHKLVTNILNNSGRIKGLSQVTDGVTIPAQEKEQEKKSFIDTPKPPKKANGNRQLKPPTVEEVKAYCDERENAVCPSEFIDHYAASGWMRGKSKIKNWKACVRTWEKNHHENHKRANQRFPESASDRATAVHERAMRSGTQDLGSDESELRGDVRKSSGYAGDPSSVGVVLDGRFRGEK